MSRVYEALMRIKLETAGVATATPMWPLAPQASVTLMQRRLVLGALAKVAPPQPIADASVGSLRTRTANFQAAGGSIISLEPEPPATREREVTTHPANSSARQFLPSADGLKLATKLRACTSEVDRTFLFAGVTSHEGVDELTANVGLALAQSGQEGVLLLDADLRVPSLLSRYQHLVSAEGQRNENGNSEGVQPFESGPLNLLTLSKEADPASVFCSHSFSAMMKDLRTKYRFTLVKGPPILTAAEANLLVGWADCIVLVVAAGKQRKPELLEAKRELASLKAKVLGAVLLQST